MDRIWHYAKKGAGQHEGPYTEDELRGLADRGVLSPSDLVWKEGMAEWVPVGNLPEFGPVLTPSPAEPGISHRLSRMPPQAERRDHRAEGLAPAHPVNDGEASADPRLDR